MKLLTLHRQWPINKCHLVAGVGTKQVVPFTFSQVGAATRADASEKTFAQTLGAKYVSTWRAHRKNQELATNWTFVFFKLPLELAQ
jgi:hypothetical protein